MIDLVLKDVSEALGVTVRKTDHLGRVGDAQFASVLVGCKGPEGANAFDRRFKEALAKVVRGRQVDVTVSFGAVGLAGTATPEQALELATQAAATAEAGGGGEP
jgi:GGDEF domain-containing protein